MRALSLPLAISWVSSPNTFICSAGVAFWNHLASQKPRRVTSRNTKEAADTWHGWPLIRP